MTHPPEGGPIVRRPIVVTRRWDQLGGRLSALVNAFALADRLGLECRFVWPRGPDAAINDPRVLFTAHFIAAHDLAESALQGTSVVSFREYTAAPRVDAAFIDVDLIFEALRLEDEPAELAGKRFVHCWNEIGWNPAVRELMSRSAAALAGFDGVGVHIRAGDIIDGDWRHIVGHEKYLPTAYFEHALATFAAEGRRVLVLSDNTRYLERLRSQHPSILTAAELIPGYGELPDLHAALADILVLSHCERIIGPPFSAFSRLGALIGRRPFARADELVSADEEPGFLLQRLTERQRELETAEDPGLGRLLARDIVWCLDVFADELAPDTVRSLAGTAARLDPDFAGGAARLARVAALCGERQTAQAASDTARLQAATVQRHDDPQLEALATAIVVACAEVIGTDPPLLARLRLTASLGPATRWRAADRARTAERLAAADRDLAAAETLHPIWGDRDRILEALSALIATARHVGGRSPAFRHRVAGALRMPPRPEAPERLAGLTAHRQELMFDPLRRDLARIVQRIFTAVHAAARRSAP